VAAFYVSVVHVPSLCSRLATNICLIYWTCVTSNFCVLSETLLIFLYDPVSKSHLLNLHKM
jgi:hypothetical protein